MDTSLIDQTTYFESDLIDIGALPLAVLGSWRGPAIRTAMQDAMAAAGPVDVFDQSDCPDWAN